MPSGLPSAHAYHQGIPPENLNPENSSASRDIYSQPNPTLESSSLNLPETRRPSASIAEDEFPHYDLLYKLADLFFKHINTWCPILHRQSTLSRLFQPNLELEDKILLHAIVATTMRFCGDERLTKEVRDRQHKISEDKVILYGMKHSSVKALQALVILSLDLIGDSNGPPGWNMLAVMTRSVVQLGLAVESTSLSVAPIFPSIYTLRAMILPEPIDFIEEESRRRLFWVIYLLDRYATTATAFDYALGDKDIDRRLPCRDDLFNKNEAVETRWFRHSERVEYSGDKPENLGSFSYYIEVLGILSKIHAFLKKPVDIGALSDVESWQREYRELDRELRTWKYNLPNEYGNMSRVFDPSSKNKVVNCGWVMLHAAFQT
jgi:Fungal specific transcription factor domain